jgi:hypothetical protein
MRGQIAQGERGVKFAILSLSRTGSTAVYRALAAATQKSIAYEPDFSIAGIDPDAIRQTCFDLCRKYDGIKHVWDPNGWPFRNLEDPPAIERLRQADELIVPNQVVANSFDKVVILRRKNVFERTLSDLLGHQTGFWGHFPDRPHSINEVLDYKKRIEEHAFNAINEQVFSWYMQNAWNTENVLISGIAAEKVKIFFYENLFNCDEQEPRDFLAWRELTSWIGTAINFNDGRFFDMVSPLSKFNSNEIYKRIPNYEALLTQFGSTTSVLFA